MMKYQEYRHCGECWMLDLELELSLSLHAYQKGSSKILCDEDLCYYNHERNIIKYLEV